MSEENSNLRPNSENSEEKNSARAGEATLEPVRTATAGTNVGGRMSIGPYVLVKILGEGGMGQVWLAEQTAPVKRKVALKLIKGGLYDSAVIQRFESERQSLAVMNHPAIAKVFDAGSTADGQPYFVMEYVEGPPITRYCDNKKLKIQERLELFIKVCEGVQHAHQKAIIHRDLKPSNVLVVEVDGKPVPRIIDFGLAKAISPQPGAEQTQFTQMGAVLGTRGFMSPEQADPSVLDVDTRTDVYSLGVVLYVLLTGMLPFETERGTRKPVDEVLRQLREEDPLSPSTKVNTEKDTATAAAESRGTEPKYLAHELRGDLDWITLKAVEKDRTRRYPSASGLAADIQRYLKDEPITARPPTAGYQLQKFARRNRALVTGLAAVFAVLMAGIVVSTWQAIRAKRAGQMALTERDRAVQAEARTRIERDRAAVAEQEATQERDKAVASQTQAVQERNRALKEKQRADGEAATAKAVNDFLQNDLLAQASASKQAKPGTKPDPDLKVRTALERAAAGIHGKFDKQPLVEASIRETMGSAYDDLGLYAEAQQQMERSLELRREELGADHPDTLRMMNDLGTLHSAQGKFAEAEPILAQALKAERRVLGAEHPETLNTMNNLGLLYQYQGKYAQAEPLLSQTFEIRRRVIGEEGPDTLGSLNNLAMLYQSEGSYARAEPLFVKVVEIQRRVLGEEHPNTLFGMANLAVLYKLEGKYGQAEALYITLLGSLGRVLGEDHPSTLTVTNNLAVLYSSEEKYDQAEPLNKKVLETQRRLFGEESPSTATSMNNLGLLYDREGKYALAEPLFTKAVDVRRRVLGEAHPSTLLSMNNLAVLYRDQGKYGQAEPLMVKVLETERGVLGEQHPNTVLSMNNLGVLYLRTGNYARAEPLLTKSLEIRRHVLGDEHPDTLVTMSDEAVLYRSQGRFAESESVFTKVLEVRRRVLGPEHGQTLISVKELAATLQEEGRYADAEGLERETLEIRRRVSGPGNPNTLSVSNDLSRTLRLEGRYEDAEKLTKETLEIERRTLGSDSPDTVTSIYNLACIAAHRNQSDEALSLLSEAIDHGLLRRGALSVDKEADLKSLVGDPRFVALVARAKELGFSPQKPD
jgi:eukaryotic-like serine/threonine-protein kinase